MQVVILAGGKGTRLGPLTLETPKPLVKLAGKPLLEHTLNALPDKISEIILIIGYLGHQIREYFGDRYKNFDISYIKQNKQLGTFHALKQAKNFLNNEFLVLMADDLYTKGDLEKLIQDNGAILVKRVKESSKRFGACLLNKGYLCGIVEKQKGIKFKYANCGAYKLSKNIFNEPIVYGSNREELLSSMIGNMSKKIPIKIIKASFWFPIATSEDLKKAGHYYKNKRPPKIA